MAAPTLTREEAPKVSAPAKAPPQAGPDAADPLRSAYSSFRDVLEVIGNNQAVQLFLPARAAVKETAKPKPVSTGDPRAGAATTPATSVNVNRLAVEAVPADKAASVGQATSQTPAAPTGRPQAAVGLPIDKFVYQLASDIQSLSNQAVADFLGAMASGGALKQVLARYRELHQTTVRDALIAANRSGDDSRPWHFVRAMATLYGGDGAEDQPWAQMGLSVIPPRTADENLYRLLTERKLPQRLRLKATYNQAFAGIGLTPNDTLEEHVAADTWSFERQRALALLDHDLTDADHLSFVTTAIVGAHQTTALEILQRDWRDGMASFDRLFADWDRYVKAPGYTKLGLEAAMDSELTGLEVDVARYIFQEYHAVKEGRYSYPVAASIVASSTVSRGLSGGILTTDARAIKTGARDLRLAVEAEQKADPTRPSTIPGTLRDSAQEKIKAGAVSLGDPDRVEALIQLDREPTYADRIYLASRRGQYADALAKAIGAWKSGEEGTIDRDLRAGSDPRPALAGHVIPPADENAPAYSALTHPGLSHAERGAVRLELALHSLTGDTKADELAAAAQFLRIIDPKSRKLVIEAYVARYFDSATGRRFGTVREEGTPTAGDAQERFYRAVQTAASGFEESVTLVDLLRLIRPEAGLKDTLKLAERREAATHTGRVDDLATAMVAIYDELTAEHTIEFADAALRRLRRWVHLAEVKPDELRAIAEAEGVTTVTELATKSYDELAARLDEVRSVKNTISQAVGTFADIAVRSFFVALGGPAGLPGLASALGAQLAGIAVRGGLLGAEYQSVSKATISNAVGDIAALGLFEGLKIESVIQELVPKGALRGKVGKLGVTEGTGILERQGLTELQAKFVQDSLTQMGSKLFEKSAQNAVENQPFPGIGEILARAGYALTVAGFKGLASVINVKADIFASPAQRLRTNVGATLLKGPPPKFSLGPAMFKEMTDIWQSPDSANATFAEKLVRVSKVGVASLVSALPVAGAFTVLGEREAAELRAGAGGDPEDYLNRLVLRPPTFSRTVVRPPARR
jgi:hypothetical protein